jgi:hypothetical protein
MKMCDMMETSQQKPASKPVKEGDFWLAFGMLCGLLLVIGGAVWFFESLGPKPTLKSAEAAAAAYLNDLYARSSAVHADEMVVVKNQMNKNAASLNAMTNQWGGGITLLPYAVAGGRYTLTYFGVPASVCARFVGQVAHDATNVLVYPDKTGIGQTVFVRGFPSKGLMEKVCAAADGQPVSVNIIGK